MNFEEFNDIILNIDNFKIDKDFIMDSFNNHVYNKIIVGYYNKFIEEGSSQFKKYGSVVPKSKIYELEHCNKFWLIDRYDKNLVKDFVGTYTCKDKFCNNCKKLKQAVRMSRYIPELEKYSSCLYHITFTVPNVVGKELKSTLFKMKKSFRKLIRIFRGNYSCFIDLSRFGNYLGAIRSLETTFLYDIYHPHYHCAFAIKDLMLEKKFINKYSYSNKSSEIRLFSEFEIIIQKLWYMIYNDISLTQENFDNLECGYSCVVDKFKDNDYAEVFKYMTKGTNEEDDILTYDNFKTIYISTLGVKQIQGYGCFYRINDTPITQEEIDEVYASIKLFLDSDELPQIIGENPYDLLNDNNYLLISRKKIYQYLKNLKNQ